MAKPLFESHLRSLPLLRRGKVRDLYAIGRERLLLVATDRLSAFDVVLPDPIPEKGRVLTRLSRFWYGKLVEGRYPHALIWDFPLERHLFPEELVEIEGRTVVMKRLKPLPIEAIVRGYLLGSAWKAYRETGQVCGIRLPRGLGLAEKLPEPIFTPSTKAEEGHDINITFEQAAGLVGRHVAERVREISLAIYREAFAYAFERGIIIADTKMEFGLDEAGNLYLIDELLTPDASRFWSREDYRIGVSPPSYDKQIVRDYLEKIGWNKKPPAPHLPPEIIRKTSERYRKVAAILMGEE